MTRARGRRWARALGVLALFVLAFWLTGCDPAVFWARRAHLRDIVSQLFPPDWSYLSAIVAPLLATLRMSVTGTALGVLLALILAPLCAANLPCPAPVRRILRFLVQVLRSFPALILALLATFLFGLGTFSGTVAITLFTLAVMTRMTYEDIETLTLAPYRALCAMGASPARAYARAVVPEIASGYLTNALYLLETNVRHSAILGYVGAGGIGLLLNEKISWREYGRVGAILVCLFVTVCCIEWLSHVLGRIIRGERSIPRGAKCAIWAAVLVCVVVCTAGIEAPDLAHTSKSVLAAMGTGLLHPDWSFFFGTGKDGLGWLLLETVGIALAGTCLGALLALPLAFLSTPKLLPRPVALLFRVLIVAIRSVPFLIYGLIFHPCLRPGRVHRCADACGVQHRPAQQALHRGDRVAEFSRLRRAARHGRLSAAAHPLCGAAAARPGVFLGCALSVRCQHPRGVRARPCRCRRHRRAAHFRHESVRMERCQRYLPRLCSARLAYRRGLGPPAYPAHRGCRSREMKFAAANWWFALRPAFFQIFSVFVMRVLIMGLSSCYDGENKI